MLDGIRDQAPFQHRRLRFLPMTSATTPVSAAAKQQHQNDDNEDQFHKKSPLMVMTTSSERLIVNLVPPAAPTPRRRHPCSELPSVRYELAQATASPRSTEPNNHGAALHSAAFMAICAGRRNNFANIRSDWSRDRTGVCGDAFKRQLNYRS
jgi:hypothetical protein